MKRYFKVESEEVLRGLLPFSLKLKDGYLKELIKAPTWDAVSYTHLDVYKRQPI